MTRLLHYVFVRDWPLKLFSFALAVLTWLVISVSFADHAKVVEGGVPPSFGEKSLSDLPITLLSANGDVHEYRVKPAEVDTVKLQGDKLKLDQTGRQHIRVLADLSEMSPTNGLKVRLEVIAPPGLAVLKVVPEEVEILPPSPR
jgi:YbbR domain-containing protein